MAPFQAFIHLFKSGNSHSFDIPGPKGNLASTLTLPDNFNERKESCPLVILMHGFASSRKRAPLPRLARALAEAGIASIRFDFDAHGGSGGKFVEMTVESEIEDALTVLDYAKALPYVSRIGIAGHSQGGVVAGMLAGKLENDSRRPSCIALLAPAAVLKDDALAGRCMGVRYNPTNPPEYVRVLMRKLGRKFILSAQVLPVWETSALYSGKVCLIHGTSDRVVPCRYSERYHSIYADSELHLIEGESHFLLRHISDITAMVVGFFKENLVNDGKGS